MKLNTLHSFVHHAYVIAYRFPVIHQHLTQSQATQSHLHMPVQAYTRPFGSRLLLGSFLFLDTSRANAISTLSLFKATHMSFIILLNLRAILLLEDRISFDGFEFGFEIGDVVAMRAGIGATTRIGEIVAVVLGLVTRGAPTSSISGGMVLKMWHECPHGLEIPPITLAASLLLHLLRVRVDMAVLGKVARKVLDVVGSTVGETGMVTIVLFMGTGH